jgi:spoIIIJ-associated protein
VELTVLEESKGLFGKGSVRIKAWAKAEEAPAKATPNEKAPAKPAARAPKAVKAKAEKEVETVVEAPAEEAPAAKPKRGAKKAAPVAAVEAPAEAAAPTEAAQAVATQEDADRLLALAEAVLKSGDLEATIKATGFSGRYVNLEIDGKDVAYLVGKHGEVLNALQYLMNIIANQQIGNGVRITLDGNNYRRRREEALEGLATRIAEQVKLRGEEAVLDALPAFERRVVHKALGLIEGVTTYSEGEEPNRRVVIAPAD